MSFLYNSIVDFFGYDTPKIAAIKSKKIGFLYRFVQVVIFAFAFGYAIIYCKNYQKVDEVVGCVSTKVKGVAYPNFTDEELNVAYPNNYRAAWDVADYVIPPQEDRAFFVMTNAIITPNQTRGTCPEDPTFDNVICTRNESHCIVGDHAMNGNGVMTGNCVPSQEDAAISVCEIVGWCPVELQNKLPLNGNRALLESAKEFTVLIKNDISFPMFDVKRRNMPHIHEDSYLKKCRYHREKDPTCPVFTIATIVEEARQDFNKIAIKGGVIGIEITWNCNLDYDPETYCQPEYKFRRLDDPYARIAGGWNFRYAQYFEDHRRTLFKAFGIRFVITIHGVAGKFDIVQLVLCVGSALGLMGIAVTICDFFVLNIDKRRKMYESRIVEEIDVFSKEDELNALSKEDENKDLIFRKLDIDVKKKSNEFLKKSEL